MNQYFTGLLPEEIAAAAELKQKYRGMQIFKWIHHGAVSFEEMSNIPIHLRDKLRTSGNLFSSSLSKRSTGSDGTVKITIRLEDGHFIEAVLLEDLSGRKTACLSSQAGCGMGCAFCRTGTMGLIRNLTVSEIVEQMLILQNISGKISNIVFMGMGEPLENLENVRKSIEIFHHPEGLNIGLKKITLSTCGIISAIEDLISEGPAVRLAVSLISADPHQRERLMPVTRKNPLDKLKEVLKKYQETVRKRFTLEYVLLRGVNDSVKDAEKLRHFIGSLKAVVNVIPWNSAEGLPFEEPSEDTVEKFTEKLENMGITVTRRFKRGRGINGACGQLAVFENSPDSPHPR